MIAMAFTIVFSALGIVAAVRVSEKINPYDANSIFD